MNACRVALAALAVSACATDTLVGGEPRVVSGMDIAPYEFHEECASLVPGDRLDYRFETRFPGHFEIYYKDGLAHVAAVTRDDVTAESGIYPVVRASRYCVRWDAGRAGNRLDFRVRVMRVGK